MGTNPWLWSQTASSNDVADSDINWREGQAPSTINDSARTVMAAHARWLADQSGTLAASGGGGAYTLALNTGVTALTNGLSFCCTFPQTNSAGPTFALNGTPAAPLRMPDGTALPAGTIDTSTIYRLTYFTATACFVLTHGTPAMAGEKLRGDCQLVLSGGVLTLNRKNGRWLSILNSAGIPVLREIPAVGPTLSATGLTAGALYYIYASWTSGAVALEASGTGWTYDATTGWPVKSSDSTRTLVGMAMPNAGPVWWEDTTGSYVRSWFHDPGLAKTIALASTATIGLTKWVELAGTVMNVLLWNGEPVFVNGQASIADSDGTGTASGYCGIKAGSSIIGVQGFGSGYAGFDAVVSASAAYVASGDGALRFVLCGGTSGFGAPSVNYLGTSGSGMTIRTGGSK